MTQVGHSIVGAAFGVVCLPQNVPTKHTAIQVVAFVLLSNIPDLPFKNWSHEEYHVSHSIFVNLLLIVTAIFILAYLRKVRTRIGGWPVMLSGTIAWLSHLLLDSFYNHGKGIAIFWPFSDARLALPIPLFSSVTSLPPPITPEMMRIFLIEFVCYFPFLLLAILMRKTEVIRRTTRIIVKVATTWSG
jgi:membrane-bound metal-dependent hydrolase YbcI (DUF457 family)